MLRKIILKIKKPSQLLIYLTSFCLPILVMTVVWFLNDHFPFGPKSLMTIDFNQQYIGFYSFLKTSFLTGDFSGFAYSFSKSLGGEMIGILGYYLISPFNIFYILLPLSQFKWAVVLSIGLRYGAIGLSFAYLLIKRYKGMSNRPWLVPLLSTAYALSGMLVAYQMNPIFYDAMYMLPLIIVALEELIDGQRPFKYILLLASTIIMQFYMGYMICLFIIIYSFYYTSTKVITLETKSIDLKTYSQTILRVAIYSILAAGLTMFLLLPIILNLMGSKGALQSSLRFSFNLHINPFDLLAKLIVGSFDTNSWAAGPSLPNIFIGSFALMGLLTFYQSKTITKTQKIASSIVIGIFVLSFLNEAMNKIWHMGQNPAGFFFRFSWILSFFLVLLAYQGLRETKSLRWKQVLPASFLTLLTFWYVGINDFSFISKKEADFVTEMVDKQFVPLSLLFILVGLILALAAWYHYQHQPKNKRIMLSIIPICLIPLSLILLSKGYLTLQLPLTIAFWILLQYLFIKGNNHLSWILIAILSVFELGYNAYLSQATLTYTDAYKFSHMTESLKDASNLIKETGDNIFYRVGTNATYSKNDPFIADYPGTSNFSSNLEMTTRDLFNYFGNRGGNAATLDAHGNPISDSLWGIRYYLEAKPLTADEIEKHKDEWYQFNPTSTRKDLPYYYNKIGETDRFNLYENPDVLSLAYATNEDTTNIDFGKNNPVANLNFLLSQLSGKKENYIDIVPISEPELENMEVISKNGSLIYHRIDNTKPGKVRYRYTPLRNENYYFQAPTALRKAKGDINISLNGHAYHFSTLFDQIQLWNVASHQAGEEIVLEITTNKVDKLDLTQTKLVRTNANLIHPVLQALKQQEMTVTKWQNTHIQGNVTINDGSKYMITSIPYSDGWSVKVDNKPVKTKRTWNSVLSFPITSGYHDISMTYRPPGLIVGSVISLLSFVILGRLYFLKHNET